MSKYSNSINKKIIDQQNDTYYFDENYKLLNNSKLFDNVNRNEIIRKLIDKEYLYEERLKRLREQFEIAEEIAASNAGDKFVAELSAFLQSYKDAIKPAETMGNIELPKKAPARWAERTSGREVSPVDFIKKHYGQILEDGSWDNAGLSRSLLRELDLQLYNAYASWIRPNRHPEDDLHLPTQLRTKYDEEMHIEPKVHSGWTSIDELDEKAKAERRAYQALNKREQRKRQMSI